MTEADGAGRDPSEGSERDILLSWLAFHRNALQRKCSGLTNEQLASLFRDPGARHVL